jgi:hypothetical protein
VGILTEWHLITGQYPPQAGGVGDYTRLVASGLAGTGDSVHVWCPPYSAPAYKDSGVAIHRELGTMGPLDLLKAGRLLDKFPGPRRLLVQWVPHAFGFRSANLAFSLWLWNRAFAHNDHLEIMVHEPYLPLPQGNIQHTALALAHRFMLMPLLCAAKRVWTAIPKWEECCRSYALGRKIPFAWLPVISNIPVADKSSDIQAIRARYAPSEQSLVGHFGTCGGEIGTALRAVIPELFSRDANRTLLLIGNDSEQGRAALLHESPLYADRIHATGEQSDVEISSCISACDVMFQPYPDGATSRRGSLMAAISHRKPVVTTSGFLTEPLWQDSHAVLLTPARDYSQMAGSIETLLSDQGLRERLATAAGNLYVDQFELGKLVRMIRNQDDLA